MKLNKILLIIITIIIIIKNINANNLNINQNKILIKKYLIEEYKNLKKNQLNIKRNRKEPCIEFLSTLIHEFSHSIGYFKYKNNSIIKLYKHKEECGSHYSYKSFFDSDYFDEKTNEEKNINNNLKYINNIYIYLFGYMSEIFYVSNHLGFFTKFGHYLDNKSILDNNIDNLINLDCESNDYTRAINKLFDLFYENNISIENYNFFIKYIMRNIYKFFEKNINNIENIIDSLIKNKEDEESFYSCKKNYKINEFFKKIYCEEGNNKIKIDFLINLENETIKKIFNDYENMLNETYSEFISLIPNIK